MHTMTTVDAAIKNLELMSQELEKSANDPKNYNSDFSMYLEQMSWEMFRTANELKARREYFC